MRIKGIRAGVLVGLFIAAALVSIVSLEVWNHMTSANQKIEKLVMAYNSTSPASQLDPSKIVSIEENELLRNLYGRLVEFNDRNELVAGIAESFFWEDGKLVFTFSKKTTTIDGYVVDAEDAAISLKRGMVLKNSSHGELQNFLCPGPALTNIDDDCAGIQINNNRLILEPAAGRAGSFLIGLLEAADFSIIPRGSLSKDKHAPKIIDFRNTSGPYFLETDNANGAWVIAANPRHYLFSELMPKRIALLPMKAADVGAALEKSEIDLIPTTYFLSGENLHRMTGPSSPYSVHESLPFKILMAVFTPAAVRQYTAEQRFFVGDILQKYLEKYARPPASKDTFEFFQGLSDGSLDPTEQKLINELRKKHSHPRFARPMKIFVVSDFLSQFKDFVRDFPEIEALPIDKSAYLKPVEERGDVYIFSNDSAWTEDISLLGYNFGQSIFQANGSSSKDWIQKYMSSGDKAERMKLLRRLHFDLLKDAIIFPMFASPYFAVASKRFSLPFSTYSCGTELWKIRKVL